VCACVLERASLETTARELHHDFPIGSADVNVAVRCSVLQYVAACCSIMQFVAMWCSALLCVTVCGGARPQTATRCNAWVATFPPIGSTAKINVHVPSQVRIHIYFLTCCRMLQYVKICCSVLMCIHIIMSLWQKRALICRALCMRAQPQRSML